MNTSFVEDERRADEDTLALMTTKPFFAVNAIMQNKLWAGFLTTWNFGRFTYIEHFAIEPVLRSNGVGTCILQKFLAMQKDRPIVLEVDHIGTSVDAKRRIAFYQRNGFLLWQNVDYVQPPYNKHTHEVPMHLMSRGMEPTPANVAMVTSQLHKQVYNVKK